VRLRAIRPGYLDLVHARSSSPLTKTGGTVSQCRRDIAVVPIGSNSLTAGGSMHVQDQGMEI
jgi:hypothetical protein